jgi:hypothetical protein
MSHSKFTYFIIAYKASFPGYRSFSLFDVGRTERWWKCECNEGELMINTWSLLLSGYYEIVDPA